MLPIVSEISLLGVNVKKDIEDAKNEIKSSIADIKNEIKNNINIQPTINFGTPIPASTQEVKEKIGEEFKETAEALNAKNDKKNKKSFLLASTSPKKKLSRSEKAQERIDKLFSLEEKVLVYYSSLYGELFKPHMKLVDEETEKEIIVDGLLFGDGESIKEIFEIKYTSAANLSPFFFIGNRYLSKIRKSGLRIPVRFIVVSDSMNPSTAKAIKEEFVKIIYGGQSSLRFSVDFLRFENDTFTKVEPTSSDLQIVPLNT